MGEIREKKINETARHISNDLSSFDDDEDIPAASTAIPNFASTIDDTNVSTNNIIENQGYIQQSSVWKFATKVGSDRARCNICNTGKRLEQTMSDYVLVKVPY
jgi:hypothetical protein